MSMKALSCPSAQQERSLGTGVIPVLVSGPSSPDIGSLLVILLSARLQLLHSMRTSLNSATNPVRTPFAYKMLDCEDEHQLIDSRIACAASICLHPALWPYLKRLSMGRARQYCRCTVIGVQFISADAPCRHPKKE